MKIMKNIFLLCAMIILGSMFTSGYLAEGESFYDDFTSPSNDLNTSNWGWHESSTGASYSVAGGIATFSGGAIGHSGVIILHNLDKNINAKLHSFSIEWRTRNNNAVWSQKNFLFTDSNATWGGATNGFGTRIYGAGGGTDQFSSSENLNASDSATLSTTTGYSQVGTSYRTLKLIKNATNLEYILDGVSQYNQTLIHVWNGDNDNIDEDIHFLELFTAQHNFVTTYIDYVNITNLGLEETGTEVNINVTSPENQTTSNVKEDVEFTVTGDSSNYNCSLYLNDILEDTNTTVLDSVQATFYLDVNVGDNDFYINCTDNTTIAVTGTYDYWYDPNDPFINLTTPNPFNTTVFDNYSIDILGEITNEELEFINITIYDQNDVLYYTNITTSFGDPTTHEFDWSFVANGSDNGVWDMYIFGNDTSSNENELYLSFTVDNCIPNWVCSGYGTCNISDLSDCIGATDSNTCGLSYTGDLSEFPPQACDYCSPVIILHTNATECVDDWQLRLRQDYTFETCCNVTGFASDCWDDLPNPEKFFWVNTTCSQFYSEEDIASSLFDTIIKFVLVLSGFVIIIILSFVGTFARKKLK